LDPVELTASIVKILVKAVFVYYTELIEVIPSLESAGDVFKVSNIFC